MNFYDRQIKNAKEDFNYFFIKMFFCIFKIIFKLCIALIIFSVINITFFNIITLIYIIYSFVNIILIYRYYFRIIDDIKNTLGCDLIFEIDFKMVNFDIFKGVVKYEK